MLLRTPQIDRIERDCNKAIQAARAVRPRLLAGAADLEAAMQSPHFRGKLPPPEKMQACSRTPRSSVILKPMLPTRQ